MEKLRQQCSFMIFCFFLLPVICRIDAAALTPKFYPKKEIVRINGKNRVYFRLDTKDPLIYEIEGPKNIRVISRIDGVAEKSKSYRFLYQIDDQETRLLFRDRGYVSDEAYLADSEEPVSVSNSLYIQVPAGKHTYSFYDSYKNNSHVYVRVIVEKKKKLAPSVKSSPLKPVKSNSPEIINVEGKAIKYYPLKYKEPVFLLPPKGAELLIYTRLQFDYWMDEPAQYRLQLTRGKHILQSWLLITEKSNLSSFENSADKIPGQYRKITYAVPSESDTLTLKLLDRDKTVFVKFRTIP